MVSTRLIPRNPETRRTEQKLDINSAQNWICKLLKSKAIGAVHDVTLFIAFFYPPPLRTFRHKVVYLLSIRRIKI